MTEKVRTGTPPGLSTATKWREAAGGRGRRREAQSGRLVPMASAMGNNFGRGKMRMGEDGRGGRSGSCMRRSPTQTLKRKERRKVRKSFLEAVFEEVGVEPSKSNELYGRQGGCCTSSCQCVGDNVEKWRDCEGRGGQVYCFVHSAGR